jgi:hypothetical protein
LQTGVSAEAQLDRQVAALELKLLVGHDGHDDIQ